MVCMLNKQKKNNNNMYELSQENITCTKVQNVLINGSKTSRGRVISPVLRGEWYLVFQATSPPVKMAGTPLRTESITRPLSTCNNIEEKFQR